MKELQNGNEDVTSGYKIRLTFPTCLPPDVEFETFARTKCVGVNRDETNNETTVMFQSVYGYNIIEEKVNFPFTFSMKSSSHCGVLIN